MIFENLLLVLFASAAVIGAMLMLVLRHPMRVALALIATMISLGGIYGLLGVHVIAVFQIMIYVGAVMVFMVYAIMLLDVRNPSFTERYSRLLWPGLAACTVLAGVLVSAAWQGRVPWSAVASRIEDEVDARPVRLWAAEMFGNLPEDSREVSVEAVIAASMRFVEEFQGALMNFSPEPQDRLLARTNALVAQSFRLQQISIAATRIILRIQVE